MYAPIVGSANSRGDAQFSTWLHRIAVNTAKNHLAARNRSRLSNEAEIEEAEQFNHSSHLSDTNTPERETHAPGVGTNRDERGPSTA